MFDKLQANVSEHAITAAVIYSIIALFLVVVFIVNITGNQSVTMNLFAALVIGLGGVYFGYLVFN